MPRFGLGLPGAAEGGVSSRQLEGGGPHQEKGSRARSEIVAMTKKEAKYDTAKIQATVRESR